MYYKSHCHFYSVLSLPKCAPSFPNQPVGGVSIQLCHIPSQSNQPVCCMSNKLCLLLPNQPVSVLSENLCLLLPNQSVGDLFNNVCLLLPQPTNRYSYILCPVVKRKREKLWEGMCHLTNVVFFK